MVEKQIAKLCVEVMAVPDSGLPSQPASEELAGKLAARIFSCFHVRSKTVCLILVWSRKLDQDFVSLLRQLPDTARILFIADSKSVRRHYDKNHPEPWQTIKVNFRLLLVKDADHLFNYNDGELQGRIGYKVGEMAAEWMEEEEPSDWKHMIITWDEAKVKLYTQRLLFDKWG